MVPDNQKISKDIFIPQGCDHGCCHRVTRWWRGLRSLVDANHKPEGVVTEILGHVNDPGTDILSIVRAYGLPEEFPPEVMDEVEGSVPDEVAVPGPGKDDGNHLFGTAGRVSSG
ncbi:MAG: hypothetical protein ACLTBV_32500 [Enterocloster bolteae]